MSVEFNFKPFQVVRLTKQWRKEYSEDFIILNGYIRGRHVMYNLKSLADNQILIAWSADIELTDLRTKQQQIQDKVIQLWIRSDYYKEYVNKA